MLESKDIDRLIADTKTEDAEGSRLTDILEQGQTYIDPKTGITFVIIRKEGSEDVPFELPTSGVTVLDTRGYSYYDLAHVITLDDFDESEIIKTSYGDFKLLSQ